mmetsp:Transcript_44833/g.81790  ORF Transcript_44833/g.81790 Transcript_44833/m.81790 type:complete len:216 (-) Transcript_44833:201-848(-)
MELLYRGKSTTPMRMSPCFWRTRSCQLKHLLEHGVPNMIVGIAVRPGHAVINRSTTVTPCLYKMSASRERCFPDNLLRLTSGTTLSLSSRSASWAGTRFGCGVVVTCTSWTSATSATVLVLGGSMSSSTCVGCSSSSSGCAHGMVLCEPFDFLSPCCLALEACAAATDVSSVPKPCILCCFNCMPYSIISINVRLFLLYVDIWPGGGSSCVGGSA